MSNCLTFNNIAYGDGGVVTSAESEIVITTSIFKRNKALGSGGVFHVTGGKMLLENSRFVTNVAGVIGGVLIALNLAVVHITQSFCFENQAEFEFGVLSAKNHGKTVISDTKIIQNSAHNYGALGIIDYSSLVLNGSQVEDNNAEKLAGSVYLSNNSLLVAFNSSFKKNSGFQYSSIGILFSFVYLEECSFIENQVTYLGGTIAILDLGTLKISNTVFAQNEGYDILHFMHDKYLSKLETYNCLFVSGNISLKSNVKDFGEVPVKEKFIGQWPFLNQSFLEPEETPHASSKLFHIVNIFSY